MIGKLRRLRVYSPPLPAGHPDFIEPAFAQCGAAIPRSGDAGVWRCTAGRGHSTDHAAHRATHEGNVMLARWPREPESPVQKAARRVVETFCEVADAAREASEANGMLTIASIDSARDLAVTAIDQAEITGDPHWFVAAEHFVRGLHALALVGTGVEVEDEDGGEG